MNKIKVLFLCTGNSARSQMAEAFMRKYGGDQFEAYSAGLEPKEIHPYTRKVMKEIGINLAGQWSKHLSEYMGKMHFGYVITVCAQADASCPAVFPGMGQRLHWAFDDPAAFYGTDAQILDKFRQVRDEIDGRIQAWLQEQGVAPVQGGRDAAPQV
jgi:arsenate reductase